MGSPEDGRKDCGWKYGYLVNPSFKGNVTCRFCGKEGKGGIYRLKQHLVGGFRTITACPNCPEHVKEEIREYMLKKKVEKEQTNVTPDFDTSSFDDDGENGYSMMVHSHGKRTVSASNRRNKKSRHGKQTAGIKAQKKRLREKVCADIARWMYDAAIPFNAVKFDSFRIAIDSIGRYGAGMKPPSYHEVRVTFLRKELDHINNIVKTHEKEWAKTGCSIMVDRLQDRSGRNFINFLVNCSKGTTFIKSVDASSYMNTGEKIFELLSDLVEIVGPENVYQIITENDSSFITAGKLLEEEYANLYRTSCAAHSVNLMLEDIGKLPAIRRTLKQAIELNAYIYIHSGVGNMMRHFTGKRNLLKPAKTRFATSFLTLARIHKQRDNLRRMFASDEWTGSKWFKDQAGERAAHTVFMPSFWSGIVFALKATLPLIRVLRLVDGDKRPAMGYIYGSIDRAKEDIAASFKQNVDRYKQIFEIIDMQWECQLDNPLHAAGHFLNTEYFYENPAIQHDTKVIMGLYQCIERLVYSTDNQDKIMDELTSYREADGLFGSPLAVRHRKTMAPAEWWYSYGSSTPNLQQFAITILSLKCSSLGSERDWNLFEHVHSNKRNRLAQSRMDDLLYIKYNRALMRRHKLRHTIDPISLRDVDDGDEWLAGIMKEGYAGDDNAGSLSSIDAGTASEAEGSFGLKWYTRSEKASSSNAQIFSEEEEEEEDDEGYESFDGDDDYNDVMLDENDECVPYNYYVRRKKAL